MCCDRGLCWISAWWKVLCWMKMSKIPNSNRNYNTSVIILRNIYDKKLELTYLVKTAHNAHLWWCPIEIVCFAAQFWGCRVAVCVYMWSGMCVCRGDSVCVSRGPDTPAQHSWWEDVCLHLLVVLVIKQIGGTEHWRSSGFCFRLGGVFERCGCLAVCVCW